MWQQRVFTNRLNHFTLTKERMNLLYISRLNCKVVLTNVKNQYAPCKYSIMKYARHLWSKSGSRTAKTMPTIEMAVDIMMWKAQCLIVFNGTKWWGCAGWLGFTRWPSSSDELKKVAPWKGNFMFSLSFNVGVGFFNVEWIVIVIRADQ